MKQIKWTTLLFALLLFGCNQKENTSIVLKENSNNETNIKVQNGDSPANNGNVAAHEFTHIENIIHLFKQKDIEQISKSISFPLKREYPIPIIKNKAEFKRRFSEVFDQNIIDKIANSKIEDWSEVGARGTMLANGDIWLSNSDGMITAINYQSDFEKNLMKDLIAKQKENVHVSLKNFERPTSKIKTKNYLIRIDEVSTNKYRYASWNSGEKESSKPNIVIDGGKLEFDGSGGNRFFTFVNGSYTYIIYYNIIREKDSPEIRLEIQKQEKIVSTEDGALMVE